MLCKYIISREGKEETNISSNYALSVSVKEKQMAQWVKNWINSKAPNRRVHGVFGLSTQNKVKKVHTK